MIVRISVALALLLLPAVAFAQSPRGQIVGRTVDESGGPIPGAFVTLRPFRPAPALVELEALSDESGRVRFDDVPPGAYRVAAHLVGFYLVTSDIEVPLALDTEISLVMAVAHITECVVLSPRPVAFRTRGGEQLPTAYLTVKREGRRPQSVSIFPSGQPDCYAPVTADHVTLDVFGYGEHLVKRAGVDPGTPHRPFTIDPTAASRLGRTQPGPALGQVRGRVFDEYGGSIPDPSVVFHPVDAGSGLLEFGAVADARGRFDFVAVRTGTYRVTGRARGYETTVAIHEVRPGVETEVTLILRAVK